MDRNRNLIIILIVIILILIIALAGAMVYIFMNQDSNNNNNEIIVDNTANGGNTNEIDDIEEQANNMAIETFNSMFTIYEDLDLTAAQIKSLISKIESSNETNTDHIVTLSDEGITDIEQVDSTKKYNVELSYDADGYVNEISIIEITGDVQEEPEEPTQNPEEPEAPTQGSTTTDMDKLIFNTAFMSYVGNINGDRLNSLLQVIQDSNTKYPEHQITISSNNLSDLNGIASTNIYTITLSYDDDGYISNINIDQQIQ